MQRLQLMELLRVKINKTSAWVNSLVIRFGGVFEMCKSALSFSVLLASFFISTAQVSAQFGLPNIGNALPGGGSLPIPGLGGGGSGFSAAAASLATNLKTALYNQGMALALVEDAMGNKKKGDMFRSQASAIQSVKSPSKDQMVKMQKAIEENPINYSGLAKVQDEAGKKKIAEAQGRMDVVIVYNGLALASAGAMVLQKPGPSDIASAPSILEAAQLAITAIPAQTSNAKKFNEAVEAYMKQNNVSKMTSSQKAALAKKTDPNAAKNAKDF